MRFRRPKIYRFKQIDSTNNAAFRYARRGAPSGSVFISEYQTRGRGKWGRTWISPCGKNLLFSVLVHPRLKAFQAAGITQLACRSIAKTLKEKLGLQPTFKRPNDLMVGERKICGVLVEAKGRSNGDLESLVVGIGLNVNSRADELVPGATSLFEEIGVKQSRARLLKCLIAELRRDLKEC